MSAPAPDSIGPDERLGRLIGEIHRLWRARLNDRLRLLKLSQTRWMTLRVLSRSGETLPQNELAARLGVEPPTLVGILDGLAREGYIARRGSTTDRRIKTVHLTAKAQRKIKAINAIAAQLRREIMRDLSDDALRSAVATLDSMRNRLTESAKSEREPPRRRATRGRAADQPSRMRTS